jgi:hypothetical protein
MKFSARWYGGDPWVGVFAKLIFTEVVETENMDEALMGRLGELCKQLIGVGPALKKAAPSTVTAGAEQKDK